MTTATNRIEQLDDGRFISCHRSGVEMYYDRRHKITKVKCEGGVIMELVQKVPAAYGHVSQSNDVNQ